MKKVFPILLSAALMVSMSVTAWAASADKAIALGSDRISDYDSAAGYDYIYMGTLGGSPVKWRVLDDATNTGGDGFFLLSDAPLARNAAFSSANSNVWQGSDARTWCTGFLGSAFHSLESNAILATTKSDAAYNASWVKHIGGLTITIGCEFSASESILNGDKVFFLSGEEASNSDYGFVQGANYGDDWWWLRSPAISAQPEVWAGVAFPDYDHVMPEGVGNSGGTYRPAFNLDRAGILFISAAAGGKTVGSPGILTAPADYADKEWKVTLLDSSRSFSVAETAVTAAAGRAATLTYNGANTGTNEYVSAMILDSNGDLLYYGQLANNVTGGTAQLTVPNDLAVGSYTLKVFSEQINGTKMTDYASAFDEVALEVVARPADPAPSGGSSRPSGHLVTSPFTGVDAVYVDGALVAAANYTVSGGDVVLSESYLNTLKAGTHNIKIVFDDRQATGTFETKGGASIESAKTFDPGVALYVGMALSSALGAAYVSKRK